MRLDKQNEKICGGHNSERGVRDGRGLIVSEIARQAQARWFFGSEAGAFLLKTLADLRADFAQVHGLI